MLVLLSMISPFYSQAETTINISQISFIQSQSVNITSSSNTVTANVTYNPSNIPDYAEVYVELINDAILNHYDDQVQIHSINSNNIVFSIQRNSSTSSRTFVITGYTSHNLTIVQAGEPSPVPGEDSDEKFSIPGNWILTRTYTTSDAGTWYDDITFYNGLGYPDQIIQIGASSTGKNMVTPIVYDAHMREDATTYLPYAGNNTTHIRESSPLVAQQTYYTGKYGSAEGTRAYNKNIYEASSLGRINAQQKSGSAYASKQVTYTYSTNVANEVLCLKVSYGTSPSLTGATLNVSYYPASSLYKTTATDEDGGQKIEYRDIKGNVVLERSLISGTTYADTYYSYDNLGRLVWVVSPQGSLSLSNGNSYPYTHAIARQYSYIYIYDGHGNMIEKCHPGREPEYYVYDKGKRAVMYQDGNMRQNDQWIYTTYDNLGRIAEKTVVSTTRTRSSLQGLYSAESFHNKYENLTNPNIPANAQDVSVVKILYSGRYHGYTYSTSSDPAASLPFAATSTAAQSDLSTLTHGNLKYEKHLLLAEGTSQQYKETAYYYNNRGEILQTVTRYPNGNILRTSFKYDFTGNIITKEEKYSTITKLTTCTYDTRGKLLTETTRINNGTAATVTYTYDDLGRVTGLVYGNGTAETRAYNIQGWSTTQTAKKGSSNIYSQTLSYYATSKGTTPLYSGNISEWATQQASQQQETYGLQYDKQGRLISSSRYSGSSASAQNSYTERGISYDHNGNIKTLQRYASSLQDNYTYNYTGNKITSITGTNNGTAIASAIYSYDSNGNATTDGLKNLQITYNILNLPQKVTQGGATKATYGWFADGSKYSTLDNAGNGYHYIGSLIYSNSNLESTDFSQGRIALSGNTQTIHYHHKDHLGSVRAITNGSGTVIEQNDYYPFGGRHTFGQNYTQTSTNRYKFNGKEEQTMGGLNLLDYGARMYDTKTARWLVQDPLAEKYYSVSAYNYCVNNPVMFVDPDGRFVLDERTEKKYPALAAYLRNMLNEWENKSVDFKNQFYEKSSLSEEQVRDMLSYGKGPLIQVVDLRIKPDGTIRPAPNGDILLWKNKNGEFRNENNGVIRLDINNVAPVLENARTREDYLAGKLFVESVIYHESTHYGNALINKNRNGSFEESGKAFEISVYGEDVKHDNYKRIYNHTSVLTILPKIKTTLNLKPIITYGQNP